MNHTLLTFKGINYKADIWLNGKQIANSSEVVGTFRSFDFDVSRKLRSDQFNVLALRIKRPKRSSQRNPDLTFSYAEGFPYPSDSNLGIWSDVELNVGERNSPVVRYPVVET